MVKLRRFKFWVTVFACSFVIQAACYSCALAQQFNAPQSVAPSKSSANSPPEIQPIIETNETGSLQTDQQHSILQIVPPANQTQNQNARSNTLPTAGDRPATSPLAQAQPSSIDAEDKINQLFTRLALDAIPHNYTNDKDWGGQERRWDGIRFRRDEGGRLETERKWKMVNHGTWKKYSASLVDPARKFSVQVKKIHQADNGDLAFDIHVASDLRFDARQAKWSKGIQLYSLSAEGHGNVRLVVSCQMAIDMDITQFPPDLIFRPVAQSADLVVDEFRIDRVSKLGGEFAQQVTRAARKILDAEIAEKETELVEKINAELTEEADKLRLSITDAVDNKWAKDAKQLLPESIQKAFDGQR